MVATPPSPDAADRELPGHVTRVPPPGGEWLWTSACFLLPLLLYLVTLAPTVLRGDSAELQAVARTWGLPHPTGYPTYVYVTKPYTLLPFGDVAWRVNLASAVFGAAACAVLFRLARLLGAGRPAALLGALCLAVGGTAWSQAVVAEVYTLNLVFLGLLLNVSIRLSREFTARRFLAWTLLATLSTGHHASTTLLLPILAALFARGSVLRSRSALLACGLALYVVGVAALYAYVPLRLRPSLWFRGLLHPAVIDATLNYALGGRFHDSVAAYGWSEQPVRLALGLLQLARDAGWVGLALAAYGLARVRALRERLALLGAFLVSLAFAANYDVPDVEVFFLPAEFFVALGLALGAEGVLAHAAARRPRLAVPLAALALAVLPLALLLGNFRRNDRSGDHAAARWGRATLSSVPPDSSIHASWERRTTLLYLTKVEGLRPSVRIRRLSGFTERDLRLEAQQRPVFRVGPFGAIERVPPLSPE